MAEQKQCEFQLIRYVPDPVKNEFVNIGVVLRAADGSVGAVRFTRDWRRVRCIDAEADIGMLEALESELASRLAGGWAEGTAGEKPVLALFEDSLSNSLQITGAKAYLAESFAAGLEQLLALYVESAKRQRGTKRSGRAAIRSAMQSHFERAGVWNMMKQQIAASAYTRPGDPLRIDCGYRPNGVVRMFQAVSLESDSDAAKVLSFGAKALREGVARVEKASLELTSIVEPIRKAPGDTPSEDWIAEYRFAVEAMEEHGIRVLTTADLPRIAETARRELRV